MREYLYFLAGWWLWRLRFARRDRPSEPRAILVVRLDHLGDGLLSTPVFANLRAAYPNARIDLLCARWNRPAFATYPHIAHILELNPRAFRRSGERYDRTGRIWHALTALRGEYQMTITLRGTWLTLVLAAGYWLDRGAVRVSARLRRAPAPEHETDIALSILESAGIPTHIRIPEYQVSEEAARDAEDMLTRASVPEDRPIIACHVGSPVPRKRWPTPRFATLIERLTDEGAHVILVGGVTEDVLAREVLEVTNAKPTDLTGRTTFEQLAAVLRRCACFVGNDSAPMHLAAAVGVPTIGLFFATDPKRFGPRGPSASVVQADNVHALTVDAVLESIHSSWAPRDSAPE